MRSWIAGKIRELSDAWYDYVERTGLDKKVDDWANDAHYRLETRELWKDVPKFKTWHFGPFNHSRGKSPTYWRIELVTAKTKYSLTFMDGSGWSWRKTKLNNKNNG